MYSPYCFATPRKAAEHGRGGMWVTLFLYSNLFVHSTYIIVL